MPPSIVIVPAQDEENRVNNTKSLPQGAAQNTTLSSRRSIFSKNVVKTHSMPLLLMDNGPSFSVADFKRNKSTSALSPTAITRSCLRPGRYSLSGGEKQQQQRQRQVSEDSFLSDSSERSVIFSKEVKVALFQTPQERYAAEGWADYFA
jgi:hypothetical protein